MAHTNPRLFDAETLLDAPQPYQLVGTEVTLRDFFAGCALISEAIYYGDESTMHMADRATRAYALAEHMIRAREVMKP